NYRFSASDLLSCYHGRPNRLPWRLYCCMNFITQLQLAWRHWPTHRKVWALAVPMILSNLTIPLVTLVDSSVVGHLPHAHQLGAVAVGASFYSVMASLTMFLRMTTTGFAAQAAGQRNDTL